MKPKIHIVGLGTGELEDMTVKGYQWVTREMPKYARTAKHPVLQKNQLTSLQTFDLIFELEESLDHVYEAIQARLVEAARKYGEILYLVPGSPWMGDLVTEQLLRNQDHKIEIDIIDGESFSDKAMKMVKPKNQVVKIIGAHELDPYQLDMHSELFVAGIENQSLASSVKIALTEMYPSDMELVFLDIFSGLFQKIPLFELDRQKNYAYSTYIFIESIENSMLGMYNINDLKKLMAILRGPDGCPWDRKQTHESLRQCVIEEAYEVVDAIEKNDLDHLVEELGDLLLQVVFNAQIAAEEGYFNFEDITSAICQKLINRHPHVFKNEKVDNAGDAKKSWDQAKIKENPRVTYSDRLEDIPKSMSPLTRGFKIQQKAAEIGFDWPDVTGAVIKVNEEINELMEAYGNMESKKIEEELGDLLFAIINFSRFLKINPDVALNKTNRKFIDRFKFIESNAKKSLQDMTLAEMDELWETSKRQ